MPYWYINGLGWFFDILFWIALIWLIVWLIGRNRTEDKTPFDVIKMRYANGDISKKEYEIMKKDLKEEK
jgi:putative membrane protein